MAFKFRVLHVKGESNVSDSLSRHSYSVQSTHDDRLCRITEEHVNNIIYQATPKAISLDSIRAETASDSTLQKVLAALETGDWSQAKNDTQMSAYLTTNAEHDIVIRGTRLCIPATLQSQCINLAHAGHQGIVKTKALLRSKVYFPGIDRMAEDAVKLHCMPSKHTRETLRTITDDQTSTWSLAESIDRLLWSFC